MNVFSHTGVLKNPKGCGQALLKETLYIFPLIFLLDIEAIFRNYVRGCITSISAKNGSLSQMKGKASLGCRVTSRRKAFIQIYTKLTPLKCISMVFRIFYNSQNFKETPFNVYHLYKSTSAIFVSQSLHTHTIITQKSNIVYYMFCFPPNRGLVAGRTSDL